VFVISSKNIDQRCTSYQKTGVVLQYYVDGKALTMIFVFNLNRIAG